MWGVGLVSESEGVGSTGHTKIDTKSLTLPHELYASVSRRVSRRGRRLRAPTGSPGAPRAALHRDRARASGTGLWRRGPHAGGTATGPTGGVALIAIGAAAIPTYVDVCIIPRRVYTRRRNVVRTPVRFRAV